MKIVIFGASGPTGRELVKQGLARGHDVTAFVRDPARLPVNHDRLRLFQGDARDIEAVTRAIAEHTAVLSALGPRKRAGSADTPADVVSQATSHILAGMRKHGVRRFICLSSVGVGDSRGRLQAGLGLGLFFEAILVPFVLRAEFRDKERTEKLVRSSDRDWVLVRPTKL